MPRFVCLPGCGFNLDRVLSYENHRNGIRLWFARDHYHDVTEPLAQAVLTAICSTDPLLEKPGNEWNPEDGVTV